MKRSTYVSVILLSLLSGVGVTKAQSILDLQRIEALKGKRHHSETNVPEWMKPRAQSLSRKTTSPASRVLLDSARIEWTRSLNSGSIPGTAAANDVALDAAGNIYVTGKSESPGSSLDILTMKYDPSGILQWTSRYDGPAHGDDIGNAIALDISGNVYVTGFSIGDGTGYDYVTIKYNGAGVEQWVARYDGPANLSDAAADLLVGNDGSVYVTGASAGLPIGQFDYATIKYNSSGTEIWVERYAGPLEWGEDRATSLALDQAGNVYVTGYSMDTVGRSQYGYPIREFEFATIKYTSQGATEWVRRHEVPDTVSFVVPPLVAVDELGGVIVAGVNLQSLYPFNDNVDVMTIKYTSLGDESWVASYTCGGHWFGNSIALTVDTDGNVYVGSVSRGAKDSLLTMKYNAGGSEQWVARFTSASELLRVSGIALDHTGNVFVTGSETEWGSEGLLGTAMVTLKYSENGSLEWNQRYTVPGATSNRATAIAVRSGMESEGEVIVVGECGSLGMATLKYGAAGNQLWAVEGGKEDVCLDFMLHMDTDEQENVYIVAEAQTLDGRVDYMVAKYNPSGDQLWQSRFVNPVDVPGYISDMAIDPNGSVYLCGWVYQENFMFRDYLTVKFGADGGQEWVARYAGLGGSSDEMAMAIDVDDNGNSYVTGFGSSGTEWRMITVKYGFAGNEVWVRQSTDQGSGWDIEVDNAGFVYAAGVIPSGTPSEFDLIVIKYEPAGTVMWAAHRVVGQTPNCYDLAVDDSGNAYVTGYQGTFKFSNTGTLVWGSNVWGDEILLDGRGGLYFLRRGDWYLKYTTEGVFQWSYNWLLPPHFAEVDGDGNVLLIEGGHSTPLVRLVSLNPLGQGNWATDIVSSEDLDVLRASVRADASGNAYVAYESGTVGTSRITLVKYNQVAVSVNEEPELAPNSFALSQNYPNPFNPTTSIKYQIPYHNHVSLIVYDVLGREVATLVNGEQEAGSYTATFDGSGLASGMYFYRLKAGEYSETRKLLLLK